MQKHVLVDSSGIEQLLKLMMSAPRQVVLAPSADAWQVGVPVSEVMRPPYTRMMLAPFGVAIHGTCPVSGKELHLSINEYGNTAMTQPANSERATQGWTDVRKDGRPLRIFIPDHTSPTVELRNYEPE